MTGTGRSPEQTERPAFAWPPYFRPRPGGGEGAADLPLRFPTDLVDLFYLRAAPSSPTHLVAVCGCLGGVLDVLVGDVAAALRGEASEVEDQVRAAQVGQRHVFRAITAREVFVCTLDAVDQPAPGAAANAPATLGGTMQARLAVDAAATSTPLQQRGRLAIGRLDLLYACYASLANPFRNPADPAGGLHHLLVPLAAAEDVARGFALALVYPLQDPEVSSGRDNTAVVMRLVYDLLDRLQEDRRRSGAGGWFADAVIPVPSRRTLEDDLARDGYTIRGDLAIAPAPTSAPADPDASGLAARVRRWVATATADRFVLPPEATPADYRAICADVLSDLAAEQDLPMLAALSERVDLAVAPGRARPAPAADAGVPQPPSPPVPPAASAAPASAPAGRRAGGTRGNPTRVFAGDFAGAPPERPESPARAWGGDFPGSGSAKPPGAATGAPAAASGEGPSAPPARAPAPRGGDAYARDFGVGQGPAEPGPGQPRNDFAADFAPLPTPEDRGDDD